MHLSPQVALPDSRRTLLRNHSSGCSYGSSNSIKFFDGAEKYGMKFLVSKYNDCKKLCVEYHPKDLDKNNILLAFSLYGECTVNIENKSSGIAFVNYHTSEGAEEAMRNLNGTNLGSHRLYVRGIVTQAVTEDNNPKEAPIFVIEDNRRQLVTTVNMTSFRTVSDFLQFLNKLGDDHRHIGLLEIIWPDSPWPGYEVVYKHVDSENKVVIKPFEGVESFDFVEPQLRVLVRIFVETRFNNFNIKRTV